ncbi:MAG: hypothetical protein QXP01_03665 [Candidatus Hadarchaeum sp.]
MMISRHASNKEKASLLRHILQWLPETVNIAAFGDSPLAKEVEQSAGA